MSGKSRVLSVAAIAALLAGCAPPTTYTINGQKYFDSASALSAHEKDLAAQIDAVPVEPAPLAGHAVIVLPDRDRLRPLVRSTPKAATLRPDTIELAIDYQHQTLKAVGDALVKSHIFASVAALERNDTLGPVAADYDYLLVFQVKPPAPDSNGAWAGKWVLQKRGSLLEMNPIFDLGVAPVKGLASFVNSVRQNTLKLDASVNGGTPATLNAGAGANARRATGTGIVVAADGEIVTNAHVLQGCALPRVLTDGESLAAVIKAQDGENDLALLKVSHRWPAVAQFREGSIRQGDDVVVVGYPLSGLLASDVNLTSGSVSALAGIQNDTRHLQFTAPVQPGNSGGPLLDMSGHVVGVVRAKLNALAVARVTGDIPQNVNFAIKATIVRSFLETNSVAYGSSAAQRELSAADVGDIAKKFTVLIECSR